MCFRGTQYWLLTTTLLLTACEVPARNSLGVDESVSQVIVYPDTLTLDPHQSFQFLAFGRTQAGDSVPVAVRWTASVGSISAFGVYTADTSATDAVVTATLSNSTVTGTSSVKKRRIIQLVINPENTALSVGGVQQFLAYGRRNTGDSVNVNVTYSATGGTISSAGAYTAGLTPGTYHVVAKQNGGSLADTAAVTVSAVAPPPPPPPPVATVAVSPASASVSLGATQQLSAVIKDANGNILTGRTVTWSSDNPVVAVVSSSGLVTGLALGSATVSATSEGQSGTAAITVAGPASTDTVLPVASVTASAHDGNVPANTLDNNLTTRWSASGDGQWIRYDLGTVVAMDRVDIAWYLGDPVVNGPARFDVEVSLDGVAWAPVFSGQSSGQTVQLEPYAFPAVYARYVRIVGHGNSMNAWNSITEVKMHRAPDTITIAPVATVIVSPTSASISTGTNAQLSAVTKDAAGNTLTGRPVTWTSSNPAVATVSASGLVTALAVGSATITGTSEGKNATATITVYKAPVASVVINPASASVLLGATLQLGAVVKDANGNVLTDRVVTWTSANPVVATVSSTGLVTGLVLGSATITATSEGKSGSAAVTVANTPVGPEPGPTATIIFQDDFESGDLNQWEYIDLTSPRYSITTNTARVRSGTRSLETLYTPTNGTGIITKWFMPGYDEVYVKFYVMFEEGFENQRGDGAGMHFLVVAGNRIDNSRSSLGKAGQRPNGTDFFYAGIDPEEVSLPTLQPLGFYTYYPDMTGTYGQRFYQPSPKTALIGGQWQEVVYRIKLNTPGQYDGSQTLWVNGVKKIDVQNMRWRTTTDLRVNQVSFNNYMPGGPKTQHVWVDNLTVWTP